MDNCQLEDLLDEHSRTLSRAGPEAGKMSQSIDTVTVLAPLVTLAREIATLIVPINPRAEFRRELHRSLVAEARRQQAQRMLAISSSAPAGILTGPQGLPDRLIDWISQETSALPGDRRWVLGAAAVGSAVSLAGILAYVLHHRSRTAASA